MNTMESGDELLVNSKEEAINVDDEFYDLQPVLAEIFSSDLLQCNPVEASIKSEAKHLNYNTNYVPQHQEICTAKPFSSSPPPSQLISFGKSSQSEKLHRKLSRDSSVSPQIIKFSTHRHHVHAKKVMTRSPLQAQGHVMAERKRREKLSQLFITLSKAVPGLKKLDKASLLGDAIKYVQELKERVRILEEKEEEEADRNSNIPTINSKESSINNSSTRGEIKARISNNNVMIKILCKKHKGLISRIQYEMENLHLNVLDIRALPFGTCTVDITVLAEMKCEFCGTVEDIVQHLEIAFLNI